jgi:hypothetical protein
LPGHPAESHRVFPYHIFSSTRLGSNPGSQVDPPGRVSKQCARPTLIQINIFWCFGIIFMWWYKKLILKNKKILSQYIFLKNILQNNHYIIITWLVYWHVLHNGSIIKKKSNVKFLKLS